MPLRDYQTRAVQEIRAALMRSRSVCLSMQVGAGKTSVASEIIRLAVAQGRRCVFLVHRVELVHQAAARLQHFGVEPGIIKSGFRPNRRATVQVACVPTLAKREYPAAELLIADEAHHCLAESWRKIVRHYRDGGAWVLGITATPARLDGKPMGDIFDEIVEPVTTRELIDGGYLIAPRVFAPPVDLSGLHMRGGDYSIPELAERVSPLCGHVIDTWARHGRGRRTLAFAVNVAHSRLIEDGFRKVGARVAHLDGKTPAALRSKIAKALRDGELDVVTQCALWTEGVDIPELGCIVVARPTKSLSLHRQMIGRVMRTAPGKTDALVLDHAGNHHEHGSILDEIAWSLDAPPKRDPQAAPTTTCPGCYAVLPGGTVTCPECGAEIRAGRETEPPGLAGEGELVELDLRPDSDATPQQRADQYRAWVVEASQSGRKLGWARQRFRARYGNWPRLGEIEVESYRCPGHKLESVAAGPYTVVRCAYCYQRPGHPSTAADRGWTA